MGRQDSLGFRLANSPGARTADRKASVFTLSWGGPPFTIDRVLRSHNPASIIGWTMPMSSHTSRVRGVTPIARQYGSGTASRSIIRQKTPWRASSAAIVRPTGPAPTTRTPCIAFGISNRSLAKEAELRRSCLGVGGIDLGMGYDCHRNQDLDYTCGGMEDMGTPAGVCAFYCVCPRSDAGGSHRWSRFGRRRSRACSFSNRSLPTRL